MIKASADAPFRIAIAGVSHGHVKIFHRSPFLSQMDLVGVHEADDELREQYRARHGIDTAVMFSDLGRMLDETRPEAVCAFGSIRDHLMVVEAAAPRGIHVMVEKPLAISLEAAKGMAALARQHGIHLLTNYETTWYPSTHHAIDIASERGEFGAIRKVVVHDGHSGPIEIGCDPEFVTWLIDPARSGGGALPDFGCYGANLMTRLMKGARPRSVSAVAHCFKPELYPGVEDDATIIVSYENAQAVIQASWNWPIARKDIEIYAADGQFIALDGIATTHRLRETPREETHHTLPPLNAPFNDAFAHLAAVVRREIVLSADDLAELDNNVLVVEILDAARVSVTERRTVTIS
jgi:predicted dehydrogenase